MIKTAILGSAVVVAILAQLHIPFGVARALVRYIVVDLGVRELSMNVEVLEGER